MGMKDLLETGKEKPPHMGDSLPDLHVTCAWSKRLGTLGTQCLSPDRPAVGEGGLCP